MKTHFRRAGNAPWEKPGKREEKEKSEKLKDHTREQLMMFHLPSSYIYLEQIENLDTEIIVKITIS